MDEKPAMRCVDAFPVDIEGRKLIYVRDPEGMAQGVAVPYPAYVAMVLMDGSRSVSELQAALAGQLGGVRVSEEEIGALVGQLDAALLLDSAHFRAHRRQVEADFRQSPVRPAAHAGQSYPDDAKALREMIEGFFAAPEGPGMPNGRMGAPLKALVAPHIDFNRGGPCFAWAYKALAQSPPPDVFVLLGTGHSARDPFVMSRKDFETPLGLLKADREVIDRVAEAAPFDVFADEFAHRTEHSLEFQAVFLAYLYPDMDIPMVPILCGSFHDLVAGKQSPMASPAVAGFVAALRQALADSGKRTCFIAGVDLSHVGQRFGDSEPLSEAFVADVEATDRALLAAAGAMDAEGYFDVVIREGDRTRVCGTSSIYAMLQAMDADCGTLLKYDRSVDFETQQMVSFASMAFY